MLEMLAYAAQGIVLAFVAYHLVTAMWGWPRPARAAVGRRRRRFRVVVPAHDEAGVIGGVLGDVAAADYPAELVSTWVIADRCTDGTATAASSLAQVDERTAGPEGKGAAIQWHLDRHPLSPGEALVVLDADNRVPPDLLPRLADELDAGAGAVQAYLDVTNPDGSALATATALTYWASNRMVQLSRSRLGWSVDLGGTGMCLTPEALEVAGGFGGGLTEDADLAVRLVLAGVPVRWLHDVRVRDEKPEGLGVTVRQRARWVAGKRHVARRRMGDLLLAALRRRSLGVFDQALRLVQPGRSFVALLSAVLAVAAAATSTSVLFPWEVWAAAAAIQFVVPVPFLAKDGVPARYLVRYPFVTLIAALWLPIRLLSRTVDRWYHTPHGGSAPG